ncbi:winged helix-turn-helix domain-containing protein [Oleiharenicola lentus]|uniref:Winged helix-turn-helix domain-containing protein n=2 Tax=Oleiharenicola lentus TaxID=2508720 RepID=A0A4Q1CA72_9BACT|nr:winged helix-turn-helix domain-containing protein [Oleiharenicola lentus]
MEGQSQNPVAHGTPSSPANGEAVDHGAANDGAAGSAQTTSPTSAGADQRTWRKGQGSGHRDQDTGIATAVPAGFDRVCALLAEAVIGMMAGTLPSSTGQGSLSCAPTQGDSKHTTDSGATLSTISLDDQIIEELRECGSTSPAALRAKLGLQRTPCTKALNRLVAKGMLISQGSTRDRVYRLVQSSQPAAA